MQLKSLFKQMLIVCPTLFIVAGCNDDTEQPPIDFSQPGEPLLNADRKNDTYRGVAQVSGLGSQCTGFLLNTDNENAPAYLMTNGHCVGLFNSREVLINQEVNGTATFGLFSDDTSQQHSVTVENIEWASMRGTDLAVVRLSATLAELAQSEIYPFSAKSLPENGADVHVVGVPTHGIEQENQVLRRVDCKAGNNTRLLEFVWIWDQAQSSNCPGMLPGSSGSPVFDKEQNVVGVINTTTIGALPGGECYLGNPCEIDTAGVKAIANRSYWMPVELVLSCINDSGEFELNQAECALEKEQPYSAINRLRVSQSPASWSAQLDGPAEMSLKIGPLYEVDCRNAEGYEDLWNPGETFEADVSDEHQHWLLCAAGRNESGEIDTKTAGFTTIEVDNSEPVREIELSINRNDDSVSFAPIFSPPELSSYLLKFGSVDETNCEDSEGYFRFRRIPISFMNEELPVKACVIGEDEAGNPSTPLEQTIE